MKARMIIGVSIAILALCAGPAGAVLLAYEGFDYEPGELSGENGGFGWEEPWEILGHNVSDSEGSMVYEGNTNSVTGEHIGGVWYATCGPYRKLAESAQIDLRQAGTYYVSAIFQQNSTVNSGPILKLMENNITTGGDGGAQYDHRAVMTGIVKEVDGTHDYWYGGTTGKKYDGGYEFGEIMMVVIKIDAAVGDKGKDYTISFNWYESPETVPTTEPGSWEMSETLPIKNAWDLINNISVYGSKSRDHKFDEFRLGTTYADVVTP